MEWDLVRGAQYAVCGVVRAAWLMWAWAWHRSWCVLCSSQRRVHATLCHACQHAELPMCTC